jgi:hypothetical protein
LSYGIKISFFLLQFVKIPDRQERHFSRKIIQEYKLISNIYYLLEHLNYSFHFWHNCCFSSDQRVKSHFVKGIK